MKKGLSICLLSIVLLLAACQQNPDSSIIVNKDMDRLIEEAGKEDGSAVAVSDIAKENEVYQTAFSSDTMKVSVNVDATVDLPQADQMAVIRVRQQPVSQELLDRVIEALAGDEQLYDGGMTVSAPTREDIEDEINAWQSEIEQMKDNYDESEIENQLAEIQTKIDDLQAAYENTPAKIVWEGHESDGRLHSAAEMNEKSGKNDFYDWEYSLNPKGEVYYGVTNGENGEYVSLFVQNSEDYSNCIRYRKNRHGYEFVASATVGGTLLEGEAAQAYPADEDLALSDYDRGKEEISAEEYKDEAATISEEEARSTADDFFRKIGLTDFQYDEGGLYYDWMDIRKLDAAGYRKVYLFRYMRSVDGALVTFDDASKVYEGQENNEYVKRYWPVECVEVRVSDDGIVGFDYNAPLVLDETVVAQSGMKTFDEIKDIFEQMVLVTHARTGTENDAPEENTVILVDSVVLGYARISEADSFDTGLLVPVWDFRGTVTNPYGYIETGSILTVNAVDGSIINRTAGY